MFFENLDPNSLASILTATVAIAAIFVPALTSIIDNIFRLINKRTDKKQKEHEDKVIRIRTIYENYLRCLNRAFHDGSDEALAEYAQYYSLAYIYLPSEIRKEISEVNQFFEETRYPKIADKVDKIITMISNEIHKLK